jgi:hypothetical protein
MTLEVVDFCTPGYLKAQSWGGTTAWRHNKTAYPHAPNINTHFWSGAPSYKTGNLQDGTGQASDQTGQLTSFDASFGSKSWPSCYVHVLVQPVSYGTGDNQHLCGIGEGEAPHIGVYGVKADGSLCVKYGITTHTSNAAGLVTPGETYELELAVYRHATAGRFQVRLNREIVAGLDIAGLDLVSEFTEPSAAIWGPGVSNGQTYTDVMVFKAGDVDFLNADFLTNTGRQARIAHLLPVADGNYTLMAKTGAGYSGFYEFINAAIFDNATQTWYLLQDGSKTSTQQSWIIDDLPADAGNIVAIKTSTLCG